METYLPTAEVQEKRTRAYKKLRDMRDLKQKAMPHFAGPNGMRSFLQYIDESERILNGYTPSRDEQGKEAWQSNVMDNVTRAKMRAIAAGVGLKVPETKYKATNAKGLQSQTRAEIMKRTVESTFLLGNPILQSFLEVWGMLAHGVLIEHEGYLSGGAKRDVVDSFDTITGEITVKSEFVKVDGRPISIICRPQDFYWADFNRRDIQEQPCLGWVQRYTKSELEVEFSKYKNYKYVKTKKECKGNTLEENTTYYDAWQEQVADDDYEVFRFYSKEDHAYQVWINGIDLLLAPMLWHDKGQESYPFAKTISEPFANADFFVGMSFPHILEGYQESKTTMTNTIIDKLYRSLEKPFLVGLANKDLLDVESELVNQDNKIYVPDVSQVKPFPFEGVTQADLAMLNAMEDSINRLSIDPAQQGITEAGVTARATILADERARELKGVLFMFLEDLWLQKNRLRVRTTLTHYIKDKAKRTSFKDQIITIDDVVFSDGARGTLDIHIADTKDKLLSVQEIEAREGAAEKQGIEYKIVSILKNYLDEWEYDMQVIPESLYNQSRLKKETDFQDKMQGMVTIFPEYLASNKEKLFGEFVELYGETESDYNPPQEEQPMMEEESVLGLPASPQQNGQQIPTGV
jgi:hypothetical protein